MTPEAGFSGPSAWDQLVLGFRTHFHQPDIEAIRCVYSAVAAHNLPGLQVWPMLVGPAGSAKTAVLNTLSGWQYTHFIDKLIDKTFISGQIQTGKKRDGKPAPSFLHRIGTSGILVCVDFSVILGMHPNLRSAVLADFRRIYDGRVTGHYGTSENPDLDWRGRITFLVGATGAVDRLYSVFQQLGERFIMIRWDRPGGDDGDIEAGVRAIDQDLMLAIPGMKYAAHSLLESLRSDLRPVIPQEMKRPLAALGSLAVRGRTQVHREGSAKAIADVVELESNTRLPQELVQLVKGSAVIAGREVANEEDYALARRAAFDSMPRARRDLFKWIAAGGDLSMARLLDSTKRYAAEDLAAVGLFQIQKGEGSAPSEATLSPFAEELLQTAGITFA
jgi:hypothetical protein